MGRFDSDYWPQIGSMKMKKKPKPKPKPTAMPMESLRAHASELEMPMWKVYEIEELVSELIGQANRQVARRAAAKKKRRKK